jgi:hypothetical protein
MSSPIADGVLAATQKLVQQAMTGQWHDVPKTVEQRRALMDELSATASPQDHQWLFALKQAMAESDAAVELMRKAVPPMEQREAMQAQATELSERGVDDLLGMIRGSR